MAAVQELFRRLRSRRSVHRKAKEGTDNNNDNDNKPASDGGATSRLSDRAGVALPPVPPPGFLNLPDVSRDCVRRPDASVYDEIPAYAIDTRLDILRDAYLERKRAASRGLSVGGAPSQNAAEVRHGRGRPRDDDVSAVRRRRSLDGDRGSTGDDHATGCGFRRQGTPWNDAYLADSPDQLDQWVSVPESLNALHLDDRAPDTRPGRPEAGSGRRAPWYEDDGTAAHDHCLHQELRHRPDQGQASVPDTRRSDASGRAALPSGGDDANRKQYPSPPPGALSDDSGVSSPSSREGNDVSWRSGTSGRHPARHCRQYSDSDSNSSTYCRQGSAATNRWRHCQQPDAGNPPGGSTGGHWRRSAAHVRIDVSSSDTYTEYDQNGRPLSDLSADSWLRDGHVNESMSPQEYRLYLGKIANNLSKTRLLASSGHQRRLPDGAHRIRNDGGGQVSCDSCDLTSVTSLSEISTLSEREINSLMAEEGQRGEEEVKRSKRIAPQRQRPSNEEDKLDYGMANDRGAPLISQPPPPPSAFRPYPSKHGHARSSTSLVERTKPEVTSDGMLLADRLSCRVTTSKPRPLSARVASQKAGVPSNQHGRKTQNLLLSDLMRRNHDRQILVVI